MTSQAIESACAFAWRNYLLFHSGISETDNRRSALFRYVTLLAASASDAVADSVPPAPPVAFSMPMRVMTGRGQPGLACC